MSTSGEDDELSFAPMEKMWRSLVAEAATDLNLCSGVPLWNVFRQTTTVGLQQGKNETPYVDMSC